jgi:hypothetical protein
MAASIVRCFGAIAVCARRTHSALHGTLSACLQAGAARRVAARMRWRTAADRVGASVPRARTQLGAATRWPFVQLGRAGRAMRLGLRRAAHAAREGMAGARAALFARVRRASLHAAERGGALFGAARRTATHAARAARRSFARPAAKPGTKAALAFASVRRDALFALEALATPSRLRLLAGLTFLVVVVAGVGPFLQPMLSSLSARESVRTFPASVPVEHATERERPVEALAAVLPAPAASDGAEKAPIERVVASGGAPESTLVAFRVNATPWAEVEVDGTLAGPTPLTIELEPGPHRFRVVMVDGRILEETLDVSTSRDRVAFD